MLFIITDIIRLMKIASEIMSKEIVSVTPDTPLIEAVDLMIKNGFTGLPVIQGGFLIGTLVNQDLIVKGTSIHLPTFIKLFGHLNLYKKDASLIKENLRGVLGLKVEDVVGRSFFAVKEDDSIFKITDIFIQSMGLDPIPVIDQSKILVGIIRKEDLLKVLGDRERDVRLIDDVSQKEKSVNLFLEKFSNQFMLVSKRRARFWIIASILFVVVGFVIAFALILRINK